MPCSPSASQASPNKPRLLWRGAFHLPDGVALPGLAIVSSTQPALSQFNNDQSPARSTLVHSTSVKEKGTEAQTQHIQAPQPPFTLPKEQQDELCLSIEMTRHAPLRIIDVLEDVAADTNGILSIPTITNAEQLANSITTAASSTPNVHVTFETAGDVRLYVDPAEDSTVAYFERLFAYDLQDDVDIGIKHSTSASQSDAAYAFSKTALIFSFDKSTSEPSSGDVFSDPSMTYNIPRDGAMEAVIIGISRRPTDDSGKRGLVELHVGKRKTKRRLQDSSHAASTPSFASSSSFGSSFGSSFSHSARSARPDDPAPRVGLPRALSRTASASSKSKLPFPMLLQTRRRPSSEFSQPAPLSLLRKPIAKPHAIDKRSSSTGTLRLSKNDDSDEDVQGRGKLQISSEYDVTLLGQGRPTTSTSVRESSDPAKETANNGLTRRRSGNHTPGRRGEKKQKRTTTDIPDFTQSSSNSDRRTKVKEEDDSDDVIYKDIGDSGGKAGKTAAEGSMMSSAAIEERNRSLVKKLVHYQLLGKGVERTEETYAACFGPTCQGTLTALRKTAKSELIDKQVAAGIVERHLEMYL